MISGLGLAVSMIKPTFGIPIALLMLPQRYVRQVLYGAFITIPINVFLIMVLVYRSGGIGNFLEALIKNHEVLMHDVTANPVSSHAIDLNAFVSHFIGKPLDYVVQLSILIVVLGVASWALYRTARCNDERCNTLSVGIICLATLLSMHHQTYDLLLLTLPFIGLVCHRFPDEFYSSYRYGVSIGLLTILVLNYLSTNAVIPFGQQASALWLVLVSINSTILLVLFVIWTRAAYLVHLDAAAAR